MTSDVMIGRTSDEVVQAFCSRGVGLGVYNGRVLLKACADLQ